MKYSPATASNSSITTAFGLQLQRLRLFWGSMRGSQRSSLALGKLETHQVRLSGASWSLRCLDLEAAAIGQKESERNTTWARESSEQSNTIPSHLVNHRTRGTRYLVDAPPTWPHASNADRLVDHLLRSRPSHLDSSLQLFRAPIGSGAMFHIDAYLAVETSPT
jgi:hypothetical protein